MMISGKNKKKFSYFSERHHSAALIEKTGFLWKLLRFEDLKPHKPRLHTGNVTFDLFLSHQHVLMVTWKNVWYTIYIYNIYWVTVCCREFNQYNVLIKLTLKSLVPGWTNASKNNNTQSQTLQFVLMSYWLLLPQVRLLEQSGSTG